METPLNQTRDILYELCLAGLAKNPNMTYEEKQKIEDELNNPEAIKAAYLFFKNRRFK